LDTSDLATAPQPAPSGSILVLRGVKVLLDDDLARLYEVDTRTLVRTVRRHPERFPADFMFELSEEELAALQRHGVMPNRRRPPLAFTEMGVAMLSSVLGSEHAARVNVDVVRGFVRLRELLASQQDLAQRLDSLEQRYDAQFKEVIDAIRELQNPPPLQKPGIGFRNRNPDNEPNLPNER
jgi:hypothetical protein